MLEAPAQVVDGVLEDLVPLLARARPGCRWLPPLPRPGEARSARRRAMDIASAAQGSTWFHSELGRQSRARVSSRSIRSSGVPRGSRRCASMAAAISCSASTHEKVRRAWAAASTAARHALPAYDGPAASQCRASSATRSSGPTSAATAPPSASALRDPGVQPGGARRSRGGQHGVAGECVGESERGRPRARRAARPPAPARERPRRLHRFPGHGCQHVDRAATTQGRGQQQQRPGALRDRLEAPGDHVADRGRHGSAGCRSPEAGQLDQEERVAAGARVPLLRPRRGRRPALTSATSELASCSVEPGEVETYDVMSCQVLADVGQ